MFPLRDELIYWIKERHAIYLKRMAGKPKPWTQDSILQNYRFCNVHRELDTVTLWLKKYWRDPHADNPDLWFAMVVARLINWPETLQAIGFPLPWNPQRFIERMQRRKADGLKVYTGAYMTPAESRESKAHYHALEVLDPMWSQRKSLRPRPAETLASYYARLLPCKGMGSFLSAQVIADLKYTPWLADAPDWWSWAASGPGSRRGLNLVCGFPAEQPWREDRWFDMLTLLREDIKKDLRKSQILEMHAQDTQNCLCEYSKWYKVSRGVGRPRALYPGGFNEDWSTCRKHT